MGKADLRSSEIIRTDRVDVLDGIRAFAIIIVAFFHFWQQSWYSFEYKNEFLSKIGIKEISFDWLHRYGYVFVDMMILLTGFCLFLPYARYMIEGSKRPGLPSLSELWLFYKKRLVRIVPSYLFCFFVFLFAFVIPSRNYGVWTEIFKDKYLWDNVVRQLTFTQNLNLETYLYTPFNGALWTVAVEMQFYLIFPLLAWAFRKKPMITYICMNGASYAFIQFFVLKKNDAELAAYINQMPAFLGVFANGMLAALAFTALAHKLKTRDRYTSIMFTGISAAAICTVFAMMKKGYSGYSVLQRWQMAVRYPMSVLFAIFVISTCLSVRWYRFIFSNPIARFAAGISYNFYIWHQPVAVKLKEWRIPYWEGETAPNFTGDKTWMIKYTVIIFVASVIIASAVTYGIEKPFAKLFLRRTGKVEKEKR